MLNDALGLIDEQIRRLQELRRMAEDPHMFSLMRKLTEAPVNGHQDQLPLAPSLPAPSPRKQATNRRTKNIGGFTAGITSAVGDIDGDFTIHEVHEWLAENDVKIGAARPMIAISGVLQRLVERGLIEVITKGRAGIPSTYRTLPAGRSQ